MVYAEPKPTPTQAAIEDIFNKRLLKDETMEPKKEMTAKEKRLVELNFILEHAFHLDVLAMNLDCGRYLSLIKDSLKREGFKLSIVPDPSKPEAKELSDIDELMIGFAEFVDEEVGAKYEPEQDLDQSDLIRLMLIFINQKFQRKESRS